MKRSMVWNQLLIIVLLMGAAITLSTCSPEKTNDRSIIFTSDHPDPGGSSFFLVQGEVTEDSIDLILMASIQLTDRVYGLAFDIDFDPAILSFQGTEPGSYLEDMDKVLVNYLAAPQSDNNAKLVMGASQQGFTAGVVGPGQVMTLKFKALAQGTSPLRFSNTYAKTPDNKSIEGLSWYGGSVRVNR